MKTIESIDFTPLEKISNAWNDTIRQVFKIPMWLFFTISVFVVLASLYYLAELGFLFAVAAYSWLFNRVEKLKNSIWKSFALQNNWQVTDGKMASFDFVPPGLATQGHSRKIGDVVHAEFNGHKSDLLTYEFKTGSGKSEQTHNFTVACVSISKPFPHLILDSHKNNIAAKMSSGMTKVELEGDFPKFFRLYYEIGAQIDALSVITPDIMQTLIDSNQPQDIEIFNDRIYFFVEDDHRSVTRLKALLNSVDKFAREIAHKAKSARYTLSESSNELTAIIKNYKPKTDKTFIVAMLITVIFGLLFWYFLFIYISS